MKTITQLYDIYLAGDKISDTEIVYLHNHFNSASKMLMIMGERFRLSAIEAEKVAFNLHCIIEARGLTK